MEQDNFRYTSRPPAPASTGTDRPETSSTNTHAPERAPEERVWERGERCRTPEERQQKKAYFKTRKLELQRARRAANPRVDYMPSPEAYKRIRALVGSGMTYSQAIDVSLSAVDTKEPLKTVPKRVHKAN